jgi:hypothetical protein
MYECTSSNLSCILTFLTTMYHDQMPPYLTRDTEHVSEALQFTNKASRLMRFKKLITNTFHNNGLLLRSRTGRFSTANAKICRWTWSSIKYSYHSQTLNVSVSIKKRKLYTCYHVIVIRILKSYYLFALLIYAWFIWPQRSQPRRLHNLKWYN